ncbi:hypothetical protein [Streptomyces sp. ST1015]|uniref:hypothetical protein n=1 Tax=Streptomyces sp. ST1015 TaxID=1848900 RepID=UPI00223C1029|nr:hypothetical protein [Streptomyces sp. ST1015]
MTHPTAGAVIVGGTAPRSLEDLRSRRDLSVRPAGELLPAAFVDVLSAALERLPAALRATVPVIMAATDYCVAATSQYVGRCVEAHAGGRRLRPSEAMTPEPAQLLQELAQTRGWNGTGHVLISPRAATQQAVRWAWGAVTAGLHEAMIVCEVVRAEHEDGYRIAAVPVTAAGTPGPADPAVRPSSSPAPASSPPSATEEPRSGRACWTAAGNCPG